MFVKLFVKSHAHPAVIVLVKGREYTMVRQLIDYNAQVPFILTITPRGNFNLWTGLNLHVLGCGMGPGFHANCTPKGLRRAQTRGVVGVRWQFTVLSTQISEIIFTDKQIVQ